jgi:hypothetical protein
MPLSALVLIMDKQYKEREREREREEREREREREYLNFLKRSMRPTDLLDKKSYIQCNNSSYK